jgi:hypothetical protein
MATLFEDMLANLKVKTVREVVALIRAGLIYTADGFTCRVCSPGCVSFQIEGETDDVAELEFQDDVPACQCDCLDKPYEYTSENHEGDCSR